MDCLALTRNIKLSGPSKIRHQRGRDCNDADGRRALRTHFRFLAIRKYEFGDDEKTMIQWVAWHLLGIL